MANVDTKSPLRSCNLAGGIAQGFPPLSDFDAFQANSVQLYSQEFCEVELGLAFMAIRMDTFQPDRIWPNARQVSGHLYHYHQSSRPDESDPYNEKGEVL
jgi:hypothetical protein